MKFAEIVMNYKGFDWDEGNSNKNLLKHGVSDSECEQVYFNQPFISGYDTKHSQDEPRFFALGKTDSGRQLYIVFAIRNELIRIISARDMNSREKREFDKL